MDTEFTNDFSKEVWETTYKYFEDKNIDDTFKRVSKSIASAEKTEELKQEWEQKFYEMLTGFKVTLGGRIYSNAGTNFKGTTFLNCFVGPRRKYDIDSLDGILEVLQQQCFTLKSEGGWGMNFSFIRPRGSFIHGIGVESPGSVKYMEIFDKTSDIITSGSGLKSKNLKSKNKIRKGAMMACLDISHPDIEEFINAKLTPNRLSKFNISVNCSNEFMDKLISGDEKWDLIFPDTTFSKYKEEWNGNIQLWKSKGYPIIIYKTVKVSELWENIMKSTYTRNDPGVLFMDIANKTHCGSYIENMNIEATNPCAEQCLPYSGVCNLGSLNLTQFIKDNSFDFENINKYISYLVRFLDNVNDITSTPLKEYNDFVKEMRRIGVGLLGWGSALYMLKIKFASKEASELKEKLMKNLTYTVIATSIQLAKEKGMFSKCNPLKHSENFYFKQINLPNNLIEDIKKYGIRNSALFSIQPTGNTSVLANLVSGGIEPVFLHEYIRTVIVNHCPEQILSLVPKYWEGEFKETSMFKFVKEGDEQILKGSNNGITYKIDKNRGLTKEVLCIDYGINHLKNNKEYNQKDECLVTTENIKVEDHVKDLQEWGKWIDSSISKTVNVPNNYEYESFKELYLNAYKTGYLKGITTYRAGTMTTVLSKKEDSIYKTVAIKRPKELKAEIFKLKYKKDNLYVALGFLGSDVYEIFTGFNVKDSIEHAKGKIVKKSRGKYSFITDNEIEYHLSNGGGDDNADALCRVISAGLRHGCDLSFLVHQLEKTQGDLTSFSKVISRVLKKYIKEGMEISGEECPECNSKLIRSEGCAKCTNCSYSRCS